MNRNNRDYEILERIVSYCIQIEEAQVLFGRSLEAFMSNSTYLNAVSMCLLQIGELSGKLSEEFKSHHNDMPWKSIKGMRNFVAHEYSTISRATIWEAVTEDIPALCRYCLSLLPDFRQS